MSNFEILLKEGINIVFEGTHFTFDFLSKDGTRETFQTKILPPKNLPMYKITDISDQINYVPVIYQQRRWN